MPTRREFIKGLAGFGLTALGGGALVGCAPKRSDKKERSEVEFNRSEEVLFVRQEPKTQGTVEPQEATDKLGEKIVQATKNLVGKYPYGDNVKGPAEGYYVCTDVVTAALAEIGVPIVPDYTKQNPLRWVPSQISYFKGENLEGTLPQKRIWHNLGSLPEPGWMMFYGNGRSHVAIVTEVAVDGNTAKITTIQALGGHRGVRWEASKNIDYQIDTFYLNSSSWQPEDFQIIGFGEVLEETESISSQETESSPVINPEPIYRCFTNKLLVTLDVCPGQNRSLDREAITAATNAGIPVLLFVSSGSLDYLTTDDITFIQNLQQQGLVVVGSHGHQHLDASKVSLQDWEGESRASVEKLTPVFGKPLYFRYPFDTQVQLADEEKRRIVVSYGMHIISHSFETGDPAGYSAERIFNAFKNQGELNDIIIGHANIPHTSHIKEALPLMIDWAEKQGWQFAHPDKCFEIRK